MFYENYNADGVLTSISTDDEGIVTYSVGNRKTEFPFDNCHEFTLYSDNGTNQKLVSGKDGVELLHIIMLRGEARLWNNNEERETEKHSRIDEFPDTYSEMADSSIDVESEVMSGFDADELHIAIKKLKPAEQDLMHRLYLDEKPMSQEEYSIMVKLTVDGVKKKALRTRNKLKLLLQNDGE